MSELRTSNEQALPGDPYRVEPSANNPGTCPCGHDAQWTITYQESWLTERTELDQSWVGLAGKKLADDICELMNMAFEHGAETEHEHALAALSGDSTSAPETRTDLPYAVGPTSRNPWPPFTPLSTAYETGYTHGSEAQAAQLDRTYCDGAQQAAAIAHQSLKAMDKWILEGCGNRRSPLKASETPEQRRAATNAAALADAHRMYEAEHGEPFPQNGPANP